MKFLDKIIAVKDFPKKGVIFRDITPILQDFGDLQDMAMALSNLAWNWDRDEYQPKISKIVGIEARGFIFGPIVALSCEAGFVPVRKSGKLPRQVWSAEAKLEYGEVILDIHKDSIALGDFVVIVDDVLATGGTAQATAKLVEMCGGIVWKIVFLVEIQSLKGREKLKGYHVETLIKF